MTTTMSLEREYLVAPNGQRIPKYSREEAREAMDKIIERLARDRTNLGATATDLEAAIYSARWSAVLAAEQPGSPVVQGMIEDARQELAFFSGDGIDDLILLLFLTPHLALQRELDIAGEKDI